MTMIYTAAGCEPGRLWYGAPEDDPESDPLKRNRYQGAVALAREQGWIRLNPNDLFCAATQVVRGRSDIRAINFTRVQGRRAFVADELTAAEIEGRAQVAEAMVFMRRSMDGCQDAQLLACAPQIGVREGRRIHGDYTLTGDDVRGARDFDDSIARGIYLLDVHNPTDVGRPSMLQMLDAPYSIPYRCLLPRGLEGLLLAGRAISGDHEAHASYRVQSHCMATGQAAGVAAALATARGITPRALPVLDLQQALLTVGANLGPAALTS